MNERLTDLQEIDTIRIEEILASGKTVTIQFSKPIYDGRLLAEIDHLCQKYGDKVEVRFFGHYSTVFDASNLAFIPNVQWLSIDCLLRISAIESLFKLARLRLLSIGVYELDMPDILSRLQIDNIRELSVCETRKSNIDLSPLSKCCKISRLRVASHHAGFSVLKELCSLEELSLRSLSKKQSLESVSDIPKLEKLDIILGGRPNIDEFSHANLKELNVVRVLGFRSVGDLRRFPALRQLRIEDQIKLESLDMSKASQSLLRLLVSNCKSLKHIGALQHLIRLENLRIGQTNIDYDALLASPLPASLRTVSFWTGKRKKDAILRAKLDSLGYDKFTREKKPE
jgi:hypothetical protein